MTSDTPDTRDAAPAVEAVLGRERDVARITALGASTVRRRAASGTIPGAVRIGRARRYVLAVVREWAAAGCPPPTRWPRTWTPGVRS